MNESQLRKLKCVLWPEINYKHMTPFTLILSSNWQYLWFLKIIFASSFVTCPPHIHLSTHPNGFYPSKWRNTLHRGWHHILVTRERHVNIAAKLLIISCVLVCILYFMNTNAATWISRFGTIKFYCIVQFYNVFMAIQLQKPELQFHFMTLYKHEAYLTCGYFWLMWETLGTTIKCDY